MIFSYDLVLTFVSYWEHRHMEHYHYGFFVISVHVLNRLTSDNNNSNALGLLREHWGQLVQRLVSCSLVMYFVREVL